MDSENYQDEFLEYCKSRKYSNIPQLLQSI